MNFGQYFEGENFYEDAGLMIELGKANLALMSCRNALESLIKDVCGSCGIDYDTIVTDLVSIIDRMKDVGIIDESLAELFHRTRAICNKGAHSDINVTMDDARTAYTYMTEIYSNYSMHAMNDNKMEELKALNNVPMQDPDYYSESRRYYGKWSHCFDRNSIMVIPEYNALVTKAKGYIDEVESLLDIAVGFLPKNIEWTPNILINNPPLIYHGKTFSNEDSYDARYYYWINCAVEAARDYHKISGYYSKKYIATAIWECALISFYIFTNNCRDSRISGVDEYYDYETRQFQYENIYTDPINEALELANYSANDPDDNNIYFRVPFTDGYDELIKDIFDDYGKCNIVASVYNDAAANTGLKIRFLKYCMGAYSNTVYDDNIRLSSEDAENINRDYAQLRAATNGSNNNYRPVAEGDYLSWDILKPYTIGRFCSKKYQFAINQANLEIAYKKRDKGRNWLKDLFRKKTA